MSSPLQSLIACGTKLWLDSIDPDLVRTNRELGATGATSNPVIISDLIKTGRFDGALAELLNQHSEDADCAWALTDQLVRQAQAAFEPDWEKTGGDDGYVSFELDPLLEDEEKGLSHEERVKQYIKLGKHWSAGHKNRMIKVPATPAGIGALEELCVHGVTLNVTLIFTPSQYRAAREAIWKGAQRRESLSNFKSVYSIFVSRVDVYTKKHAEQLSDSAQGQVGIVNAKRIWFENEEFWKSHETPLQQEIIFASTGTKDKSDPPWKYVEALAGSDIETNPPETNEAVENSGLTFKRKVDIMPPEEVLREIDARVDLRHLEETLMEEGIVKFANPQKALLELIASKRQELSPAS